MSDCVHLVCVVCTGERERDVYTLCCCMMLVMLTILLGA